MRRWLAIAALCIAVLATPSLAQMHGGSRGGASMGRGGFSSRGPGGFRGGSSFGSAPRFGAGFGTGFRQPSFRSRQSFSGFRQPFFGPRRFRGPFFSSGRFHRRAFFPGRSPFFFGYYGYPAYYGGYGYSTADYDPGYDYYGSAYSARNDIARQQADID